MDRERALREDGRVFDTYDIEVEPHFVNPNYCYARGKGSREPTGKLSVLLILPFEDKTLPTFEADGMVAAAKNSKKNPRWMWT